VVAREIDWALAHHRGAREQIAKRRLRGFTIIAAIPTA
jgi:hypothetical protein